MHGTGQVRLRKGIELITRLGTHRRFSGSLATGPRASVVGSTKTDK
jgi:hypothetical protein